MRRTVSEVTAVYGCKTDYSFEEKGNLVLPRQAEARERSADSVVAGREKRSNDRKSNKMNHFLCFLQDYLPDSWKKAIVSFGLAGVVGVTGTASGCITQDKKPPVIQHYEIAKLAGEDEIIDLKVKTLDDKAVEQVYIQFDNEKKILKKVNSKKNGGEEAEWETSFKLPPKNYSFSIIAKDRNNQTTHNDNILVLNKNFGIYLPQLKSLAYDGIDENERAFIDSLQTMGDEFIKWVIKNKYLFEDKKIMPLEVNALREPDKFLQQLFDYNISEIGKIDLELANELKKLPDFKTIEIKDIEALEDMVALAPYKSVGGISFESMFNEGIKDKRKYSTPIQALIWSLYDHDKEYLDKKPWETEIRWVGQVDDLQKFVKYVWMKSSESNKFASERWKDFDEVADRLNSPMLIATYMKDNFSYIADPYVFQSPEKTFRERGGACSDTGMFGLYLLIRNGYEYDNFEIYKNNAAVILAAYEGDYFGAVSVGSAIKGHVVTLYIKNDLFYIIDIDVMQGPFSTIKDAVNATYRNWETYEFRDINANITKKVKRK